MLKEEEEEDVARGSGYSAGGDKPSSWKNARPPSISWTANVLDLIPRDPERRPTSLKNNGR